MWLYSSGIGQGSGVAHEWPRRLRGGVRGGGEAGGQWLGFAAAAEDVAEAGADVGGEEAVDERVGRRVEVGQALDEGGKGGVGAVDDFVDLQQVEDHVGAPAKDEDKDDDERHLDGLHLCLGN